ncbi:glycosyl transferase [Camelimonas fluminis]|uniref:Glycosyltransferase family 4 protein n=1 Tax=Camelimonas fluminis TaxID=1576911 RepID=A0ABV7UHC1_9HYPH|nr:glycosyltransferase family 4 protein [Camelimonas fluminis]GHE62029.1 glycosyl transferase [Camelimonas fluminis]
MKIAQIAPLAERCPPKFYGGTERIVSYLTEQLVDMGHDVTLFASADSVTSARLCGCCEMALRLNPEVQEQLPWHLAMMDHVRRKAAEFDVLHFHVDLLHFPTFRDIAGKTVTTLHGRQDLPDLAAFYRQFPGYPLVSISHAQRTPMPAGVNWAANVYHGLPERLLTPLPHPDGGYLAFLGRISPEKRPDRAIAIAAGAGLPLRIAAKIDRADACYWAETIEPLVRTCDCVTFCGEIGETEKADFLGNARALLFPIDWPEPFGLVMIEAMACGTPVIAWPCGSTPEIIDHGVTGFLVHSIDEAVAAVRRAGELDRGQVRARFEQRFSAHRMARDYLAVYERLAGARASPPLQFA